MRFALSVAAVAGAAMAAPGAGYGYPTNPDNVVVEVTTVVTTVYVTEGYPVATSTPAAVYSAPEVTTTVQYEAPAPAPTTSEYVEVKPSYEEVKPEPTPTPSPSPVAPPPAPSAPAPAPSSSGYMAVVDEYRAKMGMSALICDSKLESNAMDTVVSSNGAMVHKLNDGTFAQVLAPGDANNFEHVFVGGWLCEIPSLPGLDGVCAQQSQGWTYEGQTGHAEILTNKSYKKIGCALSKGIWACDLA